MWEWTISLWGAREDQTDWRIPYVPGDPNRDDVAASSQIRRVLRGGSWRDANQAARTAFRSKALPSLRTNSMGFRVVIATAVSEPIS